jgi:hypothetical protein
MKYPVGSCFSRIQTLASATGIFFWAVPDAAASICDSLLLPSDDALRLLPAPGEP